MNKKKFINNAAEIIPPVNDSRYERILAIGDVHSSFTKLEALWEELSVTKRDFVVFLGDYLGGYEKKDIETLRWLIEQSKQENVICLRGNTDDDYLEYIFEKDGTFSEEALYLSIVHDMKAASVEEPDLPKKVFNFLKSLPYYYKITIGGREYIFCHAGLRVGAPVSDEQKDYLIGHFSCKNFYENYSGDAVVVVGHKRPKKIFNVLPQLFEGVEEKVFFNEPLKIPGKNILMLDTHAKEARGFLSCVDIISGACYSVGFQNRKEESAMNKKKFINDAKEIIPPVNDSPYKRILAVGDIHGKISKLLSLWEKLPVDEDTLVVFLGDYVDRGEGVGEVLDWIMTQSKKPNVIALRGNHEQMMINAFKEDREFIEKILSGDKTSLTNRDALEHEAAVLWIINGGKSTLAGINAFCAENNCTVDTVLNFAESLPLSHSIRVGGRDYIFCHAGINSKVPLDKQEEKFLLWAREEFFRTYDGDAIVISGHSPVQAFFDFGDEDICPIKYPGKNILMIDTGSFMRNGKISCLDILSGEYWQNDSEPKKKTPKNVMFVCAGNTCRSPMAKYIMSKLLADSNFSDKIFVDSAGCATRGGGRMSRAARDVLREENIPFDQHISKPFTIQDYKKFQYIVALDEDMKKIAVKISGGDPDNKIRLLKDFDGHEISVADPWYTEDYGKAYEEIILGCSALLKEIKG